jgi:quercetin dioxygenase-like cupin family protein
LVDLINWDEVEEVEARKGIFSKTVTMGKIQIVLYRYLPGSIFEVHSHPEEQMTIGIEGELEFSVGGIRSSFKEGDVVHIPSNIGHSAINRGNIAAVTLNIYNPARRESP